jgi:catechol 2,3-dioxygenase-like lactoylglutathione lyase family enzyme
MIRTHGLTHLALAVSDLDRSARFYTSLLGSVEIYRGADFVQLQTPGTWDVLVLQTGKQGAGTSGGIEHFGFRLQRLEDIDAAAVAVREAGGVVREQGEFVPGEPYLFATDPDGYEIELWFEIPTPVDPEPPTARVTRAARGRAPSRSGPRRRR